MKLRLLDLLACPACGCGDLDLDCRGLDREVDPPEVESGVLTCPDCRRAYPIVDGIPRMLPDSWQEHSGRLAFDAGVGSAARPAAEREIREFRAAQADIRASFGFEWLRYRVTEFPENARFFRDSTGLTRADLEGRLVLDAGCGMGRFAEVAAGLGAEVVGLDLSRSVERAWRETRRRRSVHFVQGDLLNPPFRREVFEVVYSLGVLHHTRDTRRAFSALCPLLEPGGEIAIWVYHRFQPEIPVGWHKRAFEALAEIVSDGTRAITTRLPHRLLHALCLSAVPLGWLKGKVAASRPLRYLLWPLLLPPVSAHPDPRVRVCDTFDWLSPRYQWKHTSAEVRGWFEAEGMEAIRGSAKAVSVRGRRPAIAVGDVALASGQAV
jgi:uncharacterized protein YbaR (Trm112 family)/2-polyprenyl-3-methyl-5-hydroxy-6-metoxy-1,4-benzoquinol methylase